MFTGLISAVGDIVSVETGEVHRFAIRSPYSAQSIEIGASIAHAGACLTVTSVVADGEGAVHTRQSGTHDLGKDDCIDYNHGQWVNDCPGCAEHGITVFGLKFPLNAA